MSPAPGSRLGPYEIVARLGVGGMGEVFRARDTKLDRDVAIKVLPSLLAQNPERLARFEREAKVLAALNHPNIAGIYGLEDRAIVMELVEGPTLADRIAAGPIPLEEALKIAAQIADALEAAHEKGVVHRDLKPANVKVREDGTVKVLDFGLATALQSSTREPGDGANSPTLTMGATEAGVILGTAAYMSPEQAAGKQVDRRADIWSFGVVLYEVLTRQRVFTGETTSHVLASVLTKEPELERVPVQVRRLLRSCLQKDAKQRLKSIGDWRLLLEEEAVVTAPPRSRLTAVAGVAAVFLLGFAALAFIHFRERAPETPALRTTILPPENAEFEFTNGLGLLALSPDGRKIAFGARTADRKIPLWVRSLDALTAQPLTGTEGATFPFWSPDGKFIAFFADGKLKRIDAAGGPAFTLADAINGRGGSWSREGVIVFAPSNNFGPLLRVSSNGGTARPVSTETGSFPWFLPDGQHFLFQGQGGGEVNLRIVAGSLDGSKSKVVATAGTIALYSLGHLLFPREGSLMAQPFDAKRLVTTGEAVPVAEQVSQDVLNSGRVGAFSVSETGLLAYRANSGKGGKAVLTWFARSGEKGATVGEAANITGTFQFSPDRKRLAATINTQGNSDIWIYDVASARRTRFTFDAGYDASPVWSPDGRSLVFRSDRTGRSGGDLYRKSADGVGTEELLYSDNVNKAPTSWSPDGRFLLYGIASPDLKTGVDLWVLPMIPERPGSPRKPSAMLQTPFDEGNAQFSPDGKWIVYQSNDSQRNEIFVMPFSPSSSGPAGKKQISTAGGIDPQWRPDGKEIFYFELATRRLMAAEIGVKGGTLEVGQVRPLFGPINVGGDLAYNVSADGQRFLIRVNPEQKSAEPLTLIQNWAAGLNR